MQGGLHERRTCDRASCGACLLRVGGLRHDHAEAALCALRVAHELFRERFAHIEERGFEAGRGFATGRE